MNNELNHETLELIRRALIIGATQVNTLLAQAKREKSDILEAHYTERLKTCDDALKATMKLRATRE
jgi:hypothetical protein